MGDTLLDVPPPALRAATPASAPIAARQGWLRLSPINRRRLNSFKANKRGWWSLWLFLVLFGLSLGAALIANDKPLAVRYDGQWYFPVLKRYPSLRTVRVQLNPRIGVQEPVRWRQCSTI